MTVADAGKVLSGVAVANTIISISVFSSFAFFNANFAASAPRDDVVSLSDAILLS